MDALPIAITRPTFVISTALATRDFQDVHHDRDLAHAAGSKDIFLNILTTPAWSSGTSPTGPGRDALVKRIAIRLGVPAYPYDTLTFTGTVDRGRRTDVTVDVRRHASASATTSPAPSRARSLIGP